MQVGGERDVRLMLSPTLFALVAATVTAALATKGARARRTELCCGRGSTAWGAVNAAAVGADHTTTTRRGQGVGHARQTMRPGARLRQATSAPCGHKYHATLLRPPRASSPPALAGRACLCKGERKVAGHGGSVERTQGAGVRSASAAPPWASGVRPGSSARCGCLLPQVVPSRPDHPSAPHVQDISRAATQAKRATADAEAPRCVWAHTAPRPPIRAELRGASFGVHRLLAALLQPALCQAEHMGRAAAQAARATPTAGLRAASARALVHQSSRHHHHDQREGRWGRQEPQIALSAHLRTWHSAPHR